MYTSAVTEICDIITILHKAKYVILKMHKKNINYIL